MGTSQRKKPLSSDSATVANQGDRSRVNIPRAPMTVTTTTPKFHMPISWSVNVPASLVHLANNCQNLVAATVEGYSTPSTEDCGAASMRLRFSVGLEAAAAEILENE